MAEAYIVAAKRTAGGRRNGRLLGVTERVAPSPTSSTNI